MHERVSHRSERQRHVVVEVEAVDDPAPTVERRCGPDRMVEPDDAAIGTAASRRRLLGSRAGATPTANDQRKMLHVTSPCSSRSQLQAMTMAASTPSAAVLRTRRLPFHRRSEHLPQVVAPAQDGDGHTRGLQPEQPRLARRSSARERRCVDIDHRHAALGQRAMDDPVDEPAVEARGDHGELERPGRGAGASTSSAAAAAGRWARPLRASRAPGATRPARSGRARPPAGASSRPAPHGGRAAAACEAESPQPALVRRSCRPRPSAHPRRAGSPPRRAARPGAP